MFTEKEIAFLNKQPLARLATVDDEGQPGAVPLGLEYDGHVFFIGGHNRTNSRKYRNFRAGHGRVAVVVDDLVTVEPWNPRGLRFYGTADFVEREGQFGPDTYMHIRPAVSWSWNVDGPAFVDGQFMMTRTVHERAGQ